MPAAHSRSRSPHRGGEPHQKAAPHAFSIWLQPPRDHPEFARLSELINKVTGELVGPAFEPHATLIGGIKAEGSVEDATNEVLRRTRRLAATLQPFQVNVLPGGLAEADTWNQDLLVFVEQTDALKQAHQAAAREFGELGAVAGFAKPTERPHVSLLYGEHSAEQRKAGLARVREHAAWVDAGLAFPAESLMVWATGGGLQGVPSWRLVGSCPLGDAGGR